MAGSGGILEYIISVRGGTAAAADVKRVAGSFNELAAAQGKANASAEEGAAAQVKARRAMKYTALAVAGIGFEAIKSSVTFSQEMQKIRADAGASTGELKYMTDQVLKLAETGKAMGASPTSLAMGLYHLESMGFRSQRALRALTVAAQASAISGASLEETTSAIGAAMFVGIKGASGFNQIMALMNATVGSGNMRMSELVDSLGTGVLSSAKLAGLSIQDVMASLAVFSDAGTHASSAAALFATALHFIQAPTDKAKGALKGLHMTQYELAADLHKPHGMLIALRDLRDHLAALPGGIKGIQAGAVLGSIFPAGRGRILQQELVMLDRLQSKYGQQARTMKQFPESVREQRNVPATQLATAQQRINAAMIRLGDALVPTVIPALITVTHLFTGLLKILPPLLPILIPLTAAWAAYTVAVSLAAAAEFLAGEPIALVVVGLAALAAGLIYAYHHVGFFRDAVDATFRFVKAHWPLLLGILTGPFGPAVVFIIGHFRMIKDAFRDVINWIIRAWDSLKFTLPSINTHIPGIGTIGGETVGVPQIAQIGQQAAAPAPRVRAERHSTAGIFGPPAPIVLKVDGQVLARSMHRQTQADQARGG